MTWCSVTVSADLNLQSALWLSCPSVFENHRSGTKEGEASAISFKMAPRVHRVKRVDSKYLQHWQEGSSSVSQGHKEHKVGLIGLDEHKGYLMHSLEFGSLSYFLPLEEQKKRWSGLLGISGSNCKGALQRIRWRFCDNNAIYHRFYNIGIGKELAMRVA